MVMESWRLKWVASYILERYGHHLAFGVCNFAHKSSRLCCHNIGRSPSKSTFHLMLNMLKLMHSPAGPLLMIHSGYKQLDPWETTSRGKPRDFHFEKFGRQCKDLVDNNWNWKTGTDIWWGCSCLFDKRKHYNHFSCLFSLFLRNKKRKAPSF